MFWVQRYELFSNLRTNSNEKKTIVSLVKIYCYEYWRSFDDIIMLSRNTLFLVTTSMPRSIPGAYGFWQGMGSRYYMVPVQP